MRLIDRFTNFINKDAFQASLIRISFDSISGSSLITIDDPAEGSLSIKIYDSSRNLLGTIKVHNGTTTLPFLPSGKYYFKLIGPGEHVVKKGKFNVV